MFNYMPKILHVLCSSEQRKKYIVEKLDLNTNIIHLHIQWKGTQHKANNSNWQSLRNTLSRITFQSKWGDNKCPFRTVCPSFIFSISNKCWRGKYFLYYITRYYLPYVELWKQYTPNTTFSFKTQKRTSNAH